MARKRPEKDTSELPGDEGVRAAGVLDPRPHGVDPGGTRITSVPLSQCLPDRFQARIILPPEVKKPYFSGEIDCYQAAGSLLEGSKHDLGLRGQVESLLSLGENILEVGQIEPATGSWIRTRGGDAVFAIEVGERRFWALALVAVDRGLDGELTLRVVEENQFSRKRQISENVQREGNTAVDRARAVAGLILLSMDIHPDPNVEDDLDYFRQVLEIKRLPNGTWSPIEKAMQLSRPVLERHLNILKLPNELVYLAKLYDVPEGRLREIIASPADQQTKLMLLAIEADLTARELKQLAQDQIPSEPQKVSSKSRPPTHKKAASRLRSFLRLARKRDFSLDYEAVAAAFSDSVQEAGDLLEAAEHLEEQARWLRKWYGRRKER